MRVAAARSIEPGSPPVRFTESTGGWKHSLVEVRNLQVAFFPGVFLFYRLVRLLAFCMNLPQRHCAGILGEWIAALALRRRGFVIRGRNIPVPTGEIDLLISSGSQRYTVEVRTRKLPPSSVQLEQAFPFSKRKKCLQNAQALEMRWRKRGSTSQAIGISGHLYIYVEGSKWPWPAVHLFREGGLGSHLR